MKKLIFGLFIAATVVSADLYYQYKQHYNQDSNKTATKGIIFKKTLNLEEYKNVSSGNDLWGKYERYSRSDRHNEALTVYCNQYCK